MTKPTNEKPTLPTTQPPSKTAVFIVLLIFLAIIFFIFKMIFGSSDTIGKYTKEELPQNFEYKIIEDQSNPSIEKNQLDVEINQKLTEGQIATLAEELFNTKDQERRFYIFYKLKGIDNKIAWATSHFDPDLKIEIFGSNYKQDNNMLDSARKVDGNIIGIFDDSKNTNFFYTLYEKDGKKFMKVSFKDGGDMVEELKEDGHKYISKDGNQGEYYILEGQQLDFYNSENTKFSTAPNVNK